MKFKGGYVGKILRINLSTQEYKIHEVKEKELELLLGGRGLAAKLYYDEIGPGVDPLDRTQRHYSGRVGPGNHPATSGRASLGG